MAVVGLGNLLESELMLNFDFKEAIYAFGIKGWIIFVTISLLVLDMSVEDQLVARVETVVFVIAKHMLFLF